MLFSPSLPSLQRKHGVSRRPSRPCTHRRRPLAVEFLEDRLVLSTNRDFVQQAFLDVLLRPVDPGSLTSLAGALDAAAVSRTDVSGFIVTSPEARAVQTQELFNRYLHRSADSSGLSAFTTILLTGGTLEQVGAAILGSPEYFTNSGGSSNLGFLDALYQDTLGRPLDSAGQAFFSAALSAGASREAIAGYVLTSPEYRTNLVQSFFQNYLARPADSNAVNVFTSALASGVRDEVVVAFIIASQEYFDRAQADMQPPGATLTSAASSPTNASPITVTVTFTESVTGFTSADLTATNGSISNFAGSGAAYTFDLTPLSQGTVRVDLAAGVAHDAAGNANTAAAQLSLIFESTAPVLDTTAPPAPSISGFSAGILTGTAEAGSTVEVLDGTHALGATQADASGNWSLTVTLGPGNHTLMATAKDAANNRSSPSTAFAILIPDPALPEAPSLGYRNRTLSGTAEPFSTVRVFHESTTVAEVMANPSGVWTAPLTLPDGTYHLTAFATDRADNTRRASSEIIVTLDASVPEAPSLAYYNGMLSGTAEPGSTVKVFQHGLEVASLSIDATGIWSFTPTLADGTYLFTATATIGANIREASSQVIINLDRTAPQAPSLSFSDSVASGTAEPFSMVQVFRDGIRVATVLTDRNGVWSLPLTFGGDGIYQLTATATDAAGNTSPVSSPLPVTVDVLPPTSFILTPEDSTFYSAGDWEGSITGTASDGGSGVLQVEVSILRTGTTNRYWDGTAFASETEKFFLATGTDSWSLSFPVENFPGPDDYMFHSQATDLRGHVELTGWPNTIRFLGG